MAPMVQVAYERMKGQGWLSVSDIGGLTREEFPVGGTDTERGQRIGRDLFALGLVQVEKSSGGRHGKYFYKVKEGDT